MRRPTIVSSLVLSSLLLSPAYGEPTEKQRQSAEIFLRCEHFYETAYEDARRNRPEFFTPGHPIQKLPEAIRTMRAAAEVLVGEPEALSIYDEHLSEWSAVVKAASLTPEAWKALSASRTAECRRIAYESDSELGSKVAERLKQREANK